MAVTGSILDAFIAGYTEANKPNVITAGKLIPMRVELTTTALLSMPSSEGRAAKEITYPAAAPRIPEIRLMMNDSVKIIDEI